MLRWFAGLLICLLLAGGCGGKPRADNSPSPSPINVSLPTALHAVELGRAQAPSATGVARITLSFPRPGGRAEFWSIIFADPSVPEGFRRVDVQATTVVDVASYALAPDEAPGSFSFDQLKFDTSRAEQAVTKLGWAKGSTVSLPPVVLDALRPPQQPQVQGRPAWLLVVIKDQALVGSAYVSAVDGKVLSEARG